MLTVFRDMKGSITIDLNENGLTVNSVSNCQLLWQNSLYFFNNTYIYIYIYICKGFILSFWKNKYQVHSYTTPYMDNFKTVCIYENLLVFAYFLKNGRIDLISLGNPTFSNIFPHARHVLNTFELWTLCAHLYLYVVYFSFAPVISASIHHYAKYSDIQILMIVTETETFNVDFTS